MKKLNIILFSFLTVALLPQLTHAQLFDNSKLKDRTLSFTRDFIGSTETWTLEKLTTPTWLTANKSALRIGRLETNTPQLDDRTALIIEPEALKIGINTGDFQPTYRLTIMDNTTSYANNNVGSVTVYNSGNVPGVPIVGIFNNTGNVSGTTTYAVGKLGGYWTGGGRNAAVHGHITGTGSAGYGVLGTVADATNVNTDIDHPTAWAALAYSTSSQFYAVYANGAQFSTSSTLWSTSDRRLKQDIQPLKGALAMVQRLQPKTYKYRQDGNYKKLSTPTETQYGFIAQEVEEVLPLLVRDVPLQLDDPQAPAEGTISQDALEVQYFKAVQNLGFIPILTAAVKEVDEKYAAQTSKLARENRELQDRVDQLEAEVKRLLAAVETNSSAISPALGRLDQNIPNPASGPTSIHFEIPDGVRNASLRITTADGKLVHQQNIRKSGKGQVNIDTSNLSNGTYFYSLFLGGKLLASKQMVISR